MLGIRHIAPVVFVTCVLACAAPPSIAQGLTALEAGDAEQDLDFDEFDIITVLQAGKHLTGQPATWGEGDWHPGTPGGSPGNPPTGDGLFNQLDLVASHLHRLYRAGPYGTGGLTPPELLSPVVPGSPPGDDQVSIVYSAATGQVGVHVPNGRQLSSLNITSLAGIFTGDPAMHLVQAFDFHNDQTIFKATFGNSFGTLSFGNVARPGLSTAFLLDDLRVAGSFFRGGVLENVACCDVPVPEPSTAASLIVGTFVFSAMLRRRQHETAM